MFIGFYFIGVDEPFLQFFFLILSVDNEIFNSIVIHFCSPVVLCAVGCAFILLNMSSIQYYVNDIVPVTLKITTTICRNIPCDR